MAHGKDNLTGEQMADLAQTGGLGRARVDLGLHQPAGLNALQERLEQAWKQVDAGAETLRRLQELLGYWQNGSAETVTICQDDATYEYHLTVGTPGGLASPARSYNGSSLRHVIDVAYAKEGNAS